LKITSNVLVTLVRAEQDCFKELFETVDITRRLGVWRYPNYISAVCIHFITVYRVFYACNDVA